MNTVALWILIMSSSQANYGGAVVVDRFETERDCLATAAEITKKSHDASPFKNLGAICVSAIVRR